MKLYNIYILKKGEFVFEERTNWINRVLAFVMDKEIEFEFIRVDSITIPDNSAKEPYLVSSTVYLGGDVIARKRVKADIEVIEKCKKKLTTLYKADGTVLYYPYRAFGVPDLKDIFHLPDNEWFTISVVKEKPQRLAIVYYDWEQFNKNRTKVKNILASKRFKRPLFGDVLYINENFIS